MEKIVSIVALTLSVIALLFGGFFNSSWSKKLNTEDVTASINSIAFGIRKIADRPIDVPSELVAKTAVAKFFPSLEPSMMREQLAEILSKAKLMNFGQAALELSLANSELSQASISDTRVRTIWKDVSAESKAIMFSVRTQRRIKDRLREIFVDIDENKLSTLVDRFEGKKTDMANSQEREFLQKPEVKAELLNVLKETSELETNPNKDKILQIMNSELPFLQAAASEVDKFSKNIEELITKADSSALSAPTYFDLSITFFNSGGTPTSIIWWTPESRQKTAEFKL